MGYHVVNAFGKREIAVFHFPKVGLFVTSLKTVWREFTSPRRGRGMKMASLRLSLILTVCGTRSMGNISFPTLHHPVCNTDKLEILEQCATVDKATLVAREKLGSNLSSDT